MLDAWAVPKGRNVTRSFIVNVRDAALAPPPANAPGGDRVLPKPRERGAFNWDDRLTLEILGDAPTAIRIEPVTVPGCWPARSWTDWPGCRSRRTCSTETDRFP